VVGLLLVLALLFVVELPVVPARLFVAGATVCGCATGFEAG
jgi:hypothetical protein